MHVHELILIKMFNIIVSIFLFISLTSLWNEYACKHYFTNTTLRKEII